jgi:RNA polymerase sigma-70 factor (ECF subfamily)
VHQTFRRLDQFEYRGRGSLDAYLRGAFMNRLRDEFRRRSRASERTSLDLDFPAQGTSPDSVAARQELVERYERGLNHLSATERELIVCRLELGMTYQEMAAATGRPTPGAARAALGRVLVKLAAVMGVGANERGGQSVGNRPDPR